MLRVRLPRRPAGRAGAAMFAVATTATVLVAGFGVGYTVTQPALGDGSAYLSRGHTVVHVNGETGRSDAEVALQLATGAEELQTVRLPDGRIAVVNKATGTVNYLDQSTLTPNGAPTTVQATRGQLDPLATDSDGYLVDAAHDTVTQISAPGGSSPAPVQVPDGILAAVPSGDSAWVLTTKGDVLEVVSGKPKRTVRLGEPPAGITVADGHPVVVAQSGTAYAVDGDEPRALGTLGVSGPDVVTGSWRGAGRYVVAVNRETGQIGALDPRTRRLTTVHLKLGAGAQLDAPVVLGTWLYVPDYSRPALWRINLATGKADEKPLEVPGRKGRFSLEVSGGRVWANNQYDRRALLIDAGGHERYVDKGAGPDVTDSQGQDNGQTGQQEQPNEPPSESDDPPATGEPDPAAELVAVPSFPNGTKYEDACATLTQLELRCRPVAGGDDGGATGDVSATDPPAGRRVPVGSRVIVRYNAPLKTPSLLGLGRTEACRVLQTAKLVCDAQPEATPAAAPDLLERVSTQDPVAGTEIPKGGTVHVTYPNTIALPSFAGQPQGEACDRLTTYRMTCTATEGDPAVGTGKTAGAVYAQSPAESTVVPVGTTVTVTFYSGNAPVGAYVGPDVGSACAAVQAAGFTCQQVEGTSAVGTGQNPGTVYAQDPPQGTVLPIGSTITLTFRSAYSDLSSTVGANPDAACAQIAAQGYVCNRVAILHPSTNVVVAQDPPGGHLPIGTAVPIQYSPWALVSYWIYAKNDADVWVLRPEGQIPAGYGRAAFPVGVAYAFGTAIPGAQNLHGFFCTAGGTKCNGLPNNHFASRATSYADPDWQGPTSIATFMPCNGQGRPIYRTWNAGSPRFYKITGDPGGAAGVELLGCVW